CSSDLPVGRGGLVEIAQQAAPIGVDQLVLGVDCDLPHPAQVDGQAAIRQCLARDRVPAAAARGRGTVGARDIDGGDHILGAGAAQDDAGVLVDHGVPHLAPLAVVGVVWTDDVAL